MVLGMMRATFICWSVCCYALFTSAQNTTVSGATHFTSSPSNSSTNETQQPAISKMQSESTATGVPAPSPTASSESTTTRFPIPSRITSPESITTGVPAPSPTTSSESTSTRFPIPSRITSPESTTTGAPAPSPTTSSESTTTGAPAPSPTTSSESTTTRFPIPPRITSSESITTGAPVPSPTTSSESTTTGAPVPSPTTSSKSTTTGAPTPSPTGDVQTEEATSLPSQTSTETTPSAVTTSTTTLSPEVSKNTVEVSLVDIKNAQFAEAEFKTAVAKYAETYCQQEKGRCGSNNVSPDDVQILSYNTTSGILKLYISGLTREQVIQVIDANAEQLKSELGYQVTLVNPPSPVPDWLIATLAIVGFLVIMAITYCACHLIHKRKDKRKKLAYQTEVSLHRDETTVGKDLEMQSSGDVHQGIDHSTPSTELTSESETTALKNESEKAPEINGVSEAERRRLSSTTAYRDSVEKEFGDIVAKVETENAKLISENEEESKASLKEDHAYDNPVATDAGDDGITRF